MDGARSLTNAKGGAAGLPCITDFSKSFYPSGDLPIDVDFTRV